MSYKNNERFTAANKLLLNLLETAKDDIIDMPEMKQVIERQNTILRAHLIQDGDVEGAINWYIAAVLELDQALCSGEF